jgi:hypothetical protein
MQMKITRRKLAAAAFSSAAALRAAQAPAAAEDLRALAREQLRKHSEELAKIDLPMHVEPAFQFKA